MAFTCAADIDLPKEKVAIALTGGHFGSHIGIIYHSVNDGMQLVHLAWHQLLLSENFPLKSGECWVASIANVTPAASKQLVGVVRGLSKHLPKIKYGVNFLAAQNSIKPDGSYDPPIGSDGLTCATFILEFFRAASLRLIDEETWKPTEANIQWANDVCDLLAKHGADAVHVDHVRSNIKGLRVRPEEVAASAENPRASWPVNFITAEKQAVKVMTSLQNICLV